MFGIVQESKVCVKQAACIFADWCKGCGVFLTIWIYIVLLCFAFILMDGRGIKNMLSDDGWWLYTKVQAAFERDFDEWSQQAAYLAVDKIG